MNEPFKNDKMYTSWDEAENEWCFYHASGVAVPAFESLEKILIRPHSIAEKLISVAVPKNPQFGSFFQYPPLTLTEKASHGVRSVGKAVKSPEVSIPAIGAIVTGVMTFLILNLNTPNPSINTTLMNVTNSAEMVAGIKLNYTAVTLTMLIAMAVFNLAVGAYKKYNEPVPDSKLFLKKIEKEIEEKEKIISAFIHFLRRKLQNFPVFEDDINFIISAFESAGTPELYIQIKKSIEFFSTYDRDAHLKILEIILVQSLKVAGMDSFLGQEHPIDAPIRNEAATKDKFALILRILENPTLITFVEKINSILNLNLDAGIISALYKNLETLSNTHTFIFELIKRTPTSSHIEAVNLPPGLLEGLSSKDPVVVVNVLSDFKEALERHPGPRQ